MRLYCLEELSSPKYNHVIKLMHNYIASLVNPTEWQKEGTWVWREMAELFISKDANAKSRTKALFCLEKP